MKRIRPSRVAAWLTCFSLVASLSTGILVGDRANAQSSQGASQLADNSARTSEVAYPTLSRYATDLTKQAREGRLESVIGRDAEISRTVGILSRDTHNNAVLIGESGLITTQIAQGLALRIATSDVPESLRDKSLFSLNLDALAFHAKDSSEFTARLQAILAEVERAKGQVILFVDQLHQFVGTFAAPAASDALRAALERRDLRIVGATSPAAYAEYIADDATVSRLFEQIRVDVGADETAEASKDNKEGDSKSNSDGEQFTGDRMSPDLREMLQAASSHSGRVSVILQVGNLKSSTLNALLKSHGVTVEARFPQFGALRIEAPLSILEKLAASGNTRYLSLDRPVQSLGHVTATTGADLIRNQTMTSPLGVTTNTKLDGTGIGIAVLDSGMDTDHVDFRGRDGYPRIAVSVDFTGENRVDDPYGHGSHVASIAGGSGRIANGAYMGIASNASLINLRVLNSQGSGNVSGTLAALDWVMNNHATYNIRVVNMSLGTAAIDSFRNDPICNAVRKLVKAGIVVVAAAGNNGKNSLGQKVYGKIHCPGNEPSAITVGASNTFGTNARNDDTVTTYSSRGPTRSRWTDTLGVKHYDNLIKPDLVAPGNKIIDAEADGNLLVTLNPQLDAGVSVYPHRKQMYLSGTSMAAPVAAGAAALLLQANPNLTPNMVKALLMYTAQPLAGSNMLEQGAGELNIEGAVRLAQLVRTDLSAATPVGEPMLTTLTPPIPQTTIAGHTFTWSQGIVLSRHFATGINLIAKYQAIYTLGTIVCDTDGTIVSDALLDGTIVSDGTIASPSDGTIVSDSILTSDGLTISDGVLFVSMDTIVSATPGTIVSDGFILLDGTIVSDSDGTIVSDCFVLAQSAMLGGDLTVSAEGIVDTGVDCLDY
ncbi:MAG TPA: S8 family serine peptidase [Pyrinomonadaceae bacterium]|nr:S8 family serine peptidase [Pyrinomonadaceae bacterium]